MKIAFDATVLQGRMFGVGYYCAELLQAILKCDERPELFVFSHRPLSLRLPPGEARVRLSDSRFCPIRAVYLHALLPGLLSRENPDLCHYTNFLAPVATDIPYVATVHDMSLEQLAATHPLPKRLYTRPLVPLVARKARLLITNSEYSKWQIVRYLGIRADRIRVTPLAAPEGFHPVQESERHGVLSEYKLTAPYFLYVGNLEPRKNLVRLIEAFAKLADPAHVLAIAGHRRYHGHEVSAAARRLGLENRVRLLQYVPREHLPALYSGATAFVYPSLLEGFGLPVVEAMACGTPVITSDNSALKEVAAGAALLVNPTDVASIQESMANVIADPTLRTALAARGLKRAAEFSWSLTAKRTLEAYEDALSGRVWPLRGFRDAGAETEREAIRRTVEYASIFQYPLRLSELHQRLFDVRMDLPALLSHCEAMGLPRSGDFVAPSPELVRVRQQREATSDDSIREIWPYLETLSRFPFIRMLAFSGATAHRNMIDPEDIDLFVVVEDGKLWAVFLLAMLWSKAKGLRRRLCLNYVITDRALPLFDHDLFTAQQVASLKPISGKSTYDRFVESNSFVMECFPNFNSKINREAYPEIPQSPGRKVLEVLLRMGPVQFLELFSRRVLGSHLKARAREAAVRGVADVLIEPRRLKLHLNSHKREVLNQARQSSGAVVS